MVPVIPYLNALRAFVLIYSQMPLSLRSFIETFICIALMTFVLRILTTRT